MSDCSAGNAVTQPTGTGLQCNYPVLAGSIALFAAMQLWLPFERGLVTGLSILALVACLWLTGAIHATLTALLVPVLAVLCGVFDTSAALSQFANPVIFLFLGGFALAAALQAQQLDEAIARRVLLWARGNLAIAILLMFAVTAALSMWISNTATTAMMLPLVLGILRPLDASRYRGTYVFVLLGTAYCASIGGIGTLVGSPPNAIAAAEAKLDFAGWMGMALPVCLLLLPLSVLILYLVIRPDLGHRFTARAEPVEWNRPRVLTLVIFALTALCWIFSSQLSAWLGGVPKLDTLIALSAIILLGVSGVVSWQQVEQTSDWGVLLLFGGGLCLSAVLRETGSSVFLANSIGMFLGQWGVFAGLLCVVTFVVCLTEFSSNVASAALLVPVFASIAESMGLSPVVLSMVIGVSASCAFMLPVATPPNAIVFSTGHIRRQDMLRAGLWLNLGCILLLTAWAWLFW